MTKVKHIVDFINQQFPFEYQESYDNSGLIIGRANDDVKGVLTALDVTEAVIEEAVSLNCNIIVSHHPIIFQGVKKLCGDTVEECSIIKAIQNNIAIIASHTNTDNAPLGTNKALAELFKLQNTSPLLSTKDALRKLITFIPVAFEQKVRDALFTAGAGVIGNYSSTSYTVSGKGSFKGGDNTNAFVGEKGKLHFEDEIRLETVFPKHLEHQIISALLKAHPYEEVAYDIYSIKNTLNQFGAGIIGDLPEHKAINSFLQEIKQKLGGVIRHTSPHTENVKRVAICSGTGIFLLSNAIRRSADIFITSDVKYHQFFMANNQITIADAGHYETEQFIKEIFFNLINKNFSNFAVHFSKVKTNPINYI